MILTEAEFINYCLRKLGAGVWEIEITPDQMKDCVNDAIAEFEERHDEGGTIEYLTFAPTEEEISNNEWLLPQEVLQVSEVLQGDIPGLGTGGSSSSFPIMNGWTNNTFGLPAMRRGMFYFGMQNYVIWKSYMETINQVMQPVRHYRFNYTSKLLRVDFPITKNTLFTIRCKVALDDNAMINLFNNAWLKAYCTALMKKQWGENMTKYTVDLGSNGVEINGQQKLQEAIDAIKELQENLDEKYLTNVLARRG